MRGGGNGVTLEAFSTLLGSTDILFSARNAPGSGPLTPKESRCGWDYQRTEPSSPPLLERSLNVKRNTAHSQSSAFVVAPARSFKGPRSSHYLFEGWVFG